MIGLGLEFGVATRANVGSGHHQTARAKRNQDDEDGKRVPGGLCRVAKPVDRASGQGKGERQREDA